MRENVFFIVFASLPFKVSDVVDMVEKILHFTDFARFLSHNLVQLVLINFFCQKTDSSFWQNLLVISPVELVLKSLVFIDREITERVISVVN